MADIGAMRNAAKTVADPTTKQALLTIIELGFAGASVGGFDPNDKKATNFKWFRQQSTGAASTAAFTIAHGMETTPVLAIPVLDLSQPGATLVPVEVVRAADGKRLYLRATSSGAYVSFLVE